MFDELSKELIGIEEKIERLQWDTDTPDTMAVILLRAGPRSPARLAVFVREAGWRGSGFWMTIESDDTCEGYDRVGIVSHGEVSDHWQWIALPRVVTEKKESFDG
jgi:hypothetical protein